MRYYRLHSVRFWFAKSSLLALVSLSWLFFFRKIPSCVHSGHYVVIFAKSSLLALVSLSWLFSFRKIPNCVHSGRYVVIFARSSLLALVSRSFMEQCIQSYNEKWKVKKYRVSKKSVIKLIFVIFFWFCLSKVRFRD
jgi:hypothetical protein